MECSRMERQKKYMEEMINENREVQEEFERVEESKRPFSGRGNVLGAPVPAPVAPVAVDPSQPVGNIQVRLGDGGRVVVRLNHSHTVGDLEQEVRAQTGENRGFNILSLGPPAKVLDKGVTVKEANLIGGAVM